MQEALRCDMMLDHWSPARTESHPVQRRAYVVVVVRYHLAMGETSSASGVMTVRLLERRVGVGAG
ncbi:uncharacterized protein ColSpa_10481 [Colletotrichum spaethianum]|uniref:Uncharacterized protein n=1 Tax=Colletotrichum spaethianum TaxID=700344 RepID=A0AA37PDJ4_9PEZI|nr:uncharacterized protein ColSpa_10481 [Colletotrichum spaethianum]GKT50300.1 hypothetical protein ColSpa_10481 [Colletotrichum spaethianum]